MSDSRKFMVRSAALAAFLWLAAAQARSELQVLDAGGAIAPAPRVMTIEEEMADLRAYAERNAASVAWRPIPAAPQAVVLAAGAEATRGGSQALDPGIESAAVAAPRALTLEEEMVDLRADAVQHARAAAQGAMTIEEEMVYLRADAARHARAVARNQAIDAVGLAPGQSATERQPGADLEATGRRQLTA